MLIKEAMTPNPETLLSTTSVMDAAKRMKDLNVGVFPVQKEHAVVGLVTDRDIVIRSMAEERDSRSTTVEEIMSAEPFTCNDTMDLEEAARIMEDKQVRRLVVLDGEGKVVGMLSLGDMATHFNASTIGKVLEQVSQPSEPAR
ncbi:MAG: CBS domain-containing protein [Chitinivibrionales bacterium]|nr:CBS domain-containing protein [Chitinivibrionales bacterium]